MVVGKTAPQNFSKKPVGWTFGNYAVPEGEWGEVATPDDVRYTFLWGVDFKASNGAGFSDAQIKYFIDDAVAQIERELNIVVKKTRFACNPDERGLKIGVDYDVEESRHVFRRELARRVCRVATDKRPILRVTRFDVASRLLSWRRDLLPLAEIDKTKGVVTAYAAPAMPDGAMMGLDASVSPFGTMTRERNFAYCIDYEAGYETAAEVPADLRQIVAKMAAVSMLNIIGRGLMSGFSSSSLSMDGLSESFSSTQSATSAYYGADIKEYKDDIATYLKSNRQKFGRLTMGMI